MIEGKRIVVTGSTSGIGRGIAARFARAGAALMLNGLGTKEEIDTARKAIADVATQPVLFHGADLTDPAQIEELIQAAREGLGGIDVLINNAGIQYTAPVQDFPPEQWDRVLAINLSACFHTMRLVLPDMLAQGWGRIINISSVHGLVASVNKAAYVATKHAVNGLTKVAALETAETGVTVNAICPGWVLTPLVARQIEARAENEKVSVAEAQIGLLSEKQPSREFATAEQIGGMCLFLCSEDAAQVTGAALTVDGGWSAQ